MFLETPSRAAQSLRRNPQALHRPRGRDLEAISISSPSDRQRDDFPKVLSREPMSLLCFFTKHREGVPHRDVRAPPSQETTPRKPLCPAATGMHPSCIDGALPTLIPSLYFSSFPRPQVRAELDTTGGREKLDTWVRGSRLSFHKGT